MARLDLAAAFDRSGKLRAPPLCGLARELWALQTYAPARPDPTQLPNGGGRSVLVIPAFLTSDWLTAGLRDYLNRCGFESHAALIGINWGPTAGVLARLRERFLQVRQSAGAPLCLVGISLGGMLARNLALDFPRDVAHVATIASPISLPTATNLEPLIRLCARSYSVELDLERFAQTPAVPWTSIYSRRDGLLAWQSCVSNAPGGVCVEVDAPHIAMARNPDALKALVMRLSGAIDERGANNSAAAR